jgi:glycosyltransferase involved in cell wall biosynthesis
LAAPRAVSAIVCTHDRPHYLAACLAGLAAQTSPAEVIVVDSASPPAGAAAIADLARRHGARLVVAGKPGLSLARNLGAAAASGRWLGYLDDDAVPDPGWAAAIAAAGGPSPPPGVLGGLIRPAWEAPLPAWWPPDLVGVLTILLHEQAGTVGLDLPPRIEPYGANFIVRADALAAIGGFPEGLGRVGTNLLSSEESLVVHRLRALGEVVRYEPAIAVTHTIQAERLTPAWLLRRQYFQGMSAVLMRRALGHPAPGAGRLARAAAKLALLSPLLALPGSSPALIGLRAQAHYAKGFLRAALG